jgi:hypothetical protein
LLDAGKNPGKWAESQKYSGKTLDDAKNIIDLIGIFSLNFRCCKKTTNSPDYGQKPLDFLLVP